MNQKLNVFLTSWAVSFKKRKEFTKLFGLMSDHIDNIPMEYDLKVSKMNKLNKLVRDIGIIQKYPIYVHQIGLKWIDLCWKKMVTENGFLNIEETIKHLELSVNTPVKDEPITHLQPFITYSDYEKYYRNTIKPINCQVGKAILSNAQTPPYLKLCNVRPSLPELEGKLYGICVEYYETDFTLRIFGLTHSDSLRVYRNMINKKSIFDDLFEKYKIVPEDATPYLNTFPYRDYLTHETRQITNKIKQQREKMDYYKTADLNVLLNEYHFLPEFMRVELLSIFLEFELKVQAKHLYSKLPFSKKFLDWKYRSDLDIQIFKFNAQKNETIEEEAPYEVRISEMDVSDRIKSKAYDKLKMVKQSGDGAPKAQKYLDGILKIPFGKIKSEPDLDDPGKKLVDELYKKYPSVSKNENITKNSTNYFKILKEASHIDVCKKYASDGVKKMEKARERQQKYLKDVQQILENCVHGHKLVKIQIRRLLAQWISGGQSGIVLGLEGPPGNGKTTMIKKGLAKCLLDKEGNSRPVGFIPLGGSSNSSSLVGHGYTYQGSTWGRITDILMDTECMNPILLFDELDKVSLSEQGREVSSILTHLTDSTQNEEFFDKYFEGVELDLSKAIMVFTFNDRSKIDPVLIDRITIIETQPLSLEDKKVISRAHLIPQISNLIDLEPSEVDVSPTQIERLINDYTREAGARQLKKLLENLIQELNLRRLIDPDTNMKINTDLVDSVFRHKDKIRMESISDDPYRVGQIYGMYANALGLGGIMPIQVSQGADSKLELTGQQGDVMKESMKCSFTMAKTLMRENPEWKKKEDDDEKDRKEKGLHIHCPSTATPKDGPSAGGAICLAIYSFLSKRQILTHIAMTGEIDLRGNITAIGGLEAKLNGAKKAKIKLALIPKENEQQLERLRYDKKSPEDEDFKVVMVEHVKDAIKYVFFDNN